MVVAGVGVGMAKEYSPEVKAQVMAALLEGQSLRHVARETGIPKGTIEHWGNEAKRLAGVSTVSDDKKERIQGLLVDLFIAKIESQIALAKHAGDKAWLLKQDASAVAMLLGVSDDKLMRMLEKYERREPESTSTED